MAAATIPALFFSQAERLAKAPLFYFRQDGWYQPITWAQARDTVESLSAYLLNLPLNPGDRVLLLSENRPEWGMADLAIQAVRASTVPIYPSLMEADIHLIAIDCQPTACIVSTPEQAKKVEAIRARVPSIRLVLVMDDPSGWPEAIRQGRALRERLGPMLAQRLQELGPDEPASILYTSGTTGEPKGVILSHRNFLANVEAGLKAIPISQTDSHLSFLPLSHVFERMAGWYLMLRAGASVAYAEHMDTLPQNMPEVRPTIMLGVPRFFEKLYARIQEGIRQAPPAKQRLIRWALSVGQATAPYRLAHRPLPLGLSLQAHLADALVLKKFRQRLGGRLRFFVSGSAPLSKTIAEFFYQAGIVILEGYGLTETSPVIAVNRLDALKFGTVGKPLEGVEVRIADDGEILTRSSSVMQGYYGKPDATREAMVDGWLHTGDIGHLDEEGFLLITDRKKDLIKTAGGKFVAPQKLEQLFTTDPYIAQAVVYGDQQPYCVALITPNLQRLTDYAKSQGLHVASPKALVALPQIQQFLWSRVQALQQPLASFEQIKAIAVLDHEFTQAAGELTPTMKAKRALITTRYQDTLRQLYRTT
jgi:long-chain acyl-CoA synthetase